MYPVFKNLADPRGTITRASYAKQGFTLAIAKVLIDKLIGYIVFGAPPFSLTYPLFSMPPQAMEPGLKNLHLLIYTPLSLVFIYFGITLTIKRLRDLSMPLWLSTLFFIPVANIIFFGLLCLLQKRTQTKSIEKPDIIDPIEKWPKAIGISALVGIFSIPLTWLAVEYFNNYSWGVFAAIPFLQGLAGGLLVAHPARPLKHYLGTALFTLMVAFIGALAFAIEGLICLVMAAPFAIGLAALGGMVAYFARGTTNSSPHRTAIMLIPFTVLGITTDQSSSSNSPQLYSCTTSVFIEADASTVWNSLLEFSDLPKPRSFPFLVGISYPVRARIEGEGIGAIRYCEFSTGPFVEPITVWTPNEELAFDVLEQPEPMTELSPYKGLHPPHLDGFFSSQKGRFLLEESNSGTWLHGTT